MKKVLIISASFRDRSNSDILSDAFMNGAKASGHSVEKISLKGKDIKFCTGCMECHHSDKCPLHDDSIEIVQKMREADVIVLATPIYFYEMCGQLKTLLDRTHPLYGRDYNFRDVYILTSSAASGDSASAKAINGIKGWVDCFSNATLKGTLCASGMWNAGDIENHEYLEQAYKLGQNV